MTGLSAKQDLGYTRLGLAVGIGTAVIEAVLIYATISVAQPGLLQPMVFGLAVTVLAFGGALALRYIWIGRGRLPTQQVK